MTTAVHSDSSTSGAQRRSWFAALRPIVPAREQLGELLLKLKRPQEALQEFRAALTSAPRRRGALTGAIAAAEGVGNTQLVAQLRADLS